MGQLLWMQKGTSGLDATVFACYMLVAGRDLIFELSISLIRRARFDPLPCLITARPREMCLIRVVIQQHSGFQPEKLTRKSND